MVSVYIKQKPTVTGDFAVMVGRSVTAIRGVEVRWWC